MRPVPRGSATDIKVPDPDPQLWIDNLTADPRFWTALAALLIIAVGGALVRRARPLFGILLVLAVLIIAVMVFNRGGAG